MQEVRHLKNWYDIEDTCARVCIRSSGEVPTLVLMKQLPYMVGMLSI